MHSEHDAEEIMHNGATQIIKMIDAELTNSDGLKQKIKVYMNTKKVEKFITHYLMYLNNIGFYSGTPENIPAADKTENSIMIKDLRTELFDEDVEDLKTIIIKKRLPKSRYSNLLLDEDINKFVDVNLFNTNEIIVRNVFDAESNAEIKKKLILKKILDNSGNNSDNLEAVIGTKGPILKTELMAKENISMNNPTHNSFEWVKPVGDKPPFKANVIPTISIKESNIDNDDKVSHVNQTDIHLSEEKIKNMELYKDITRVAEDSTFLMQPPVAKEEIEESEESKKTESPTPQNYGLDKFHRLLKPLKTGGAGSIYSNDFIDNIINNALDYIY